MAEKTDRELLIEDRRARIEQLYDAANEILECRQRIVDLVDTDAEEEPVLSSDVVRLSQQAIEEAESLKAEVFDLIYDRGDFGQGGDMSDEDLVGEFFDGLDGGSDNVH